MKNQNLSQDELSDILGGNTLENIINHDDTQEYIIISSNCTGGTCKNSCSPGCSAGCSSGCVKSSGANGFPVVGGGFESNIQH